MAEMKVRIIDTGGNGMKYKVEVGGYVSTFRHRNLVVYANNEEEAAKKAEEKFYDVVQSINGNMCEGCNIDSVTDVETGVRHEYEI